MVLEVPELEVLRLTKETRGSYHNLFIGMMALLLAPLAMLPLFIINGARLSGPMFWVGIPLASYGLFQLIYGTWQLHHALNPKMKSVTLNAPAQPAVNPAVAATTALPPARPMASVTEATTGLLTNDRRVPEPVRRKDHSTAEIDADRLM